MKEECTELFSRYREVVRLTWNLGILPVVKEEQPDMFKLGELIDLFREASARLFEALVLHPFGCSGRIEHTGLDVLGDVVPFHISIPLAARLDINENPPGGNKGNVWGIPSIVLDSSSGAYQLRFVSFFDWDQLGQRDYRYLEVLIERLDDHPRWIGHHAIIEFWQCSIWSDAAESCLRSR